MCWNEKVGDEIYAALRKEEMRYSSDEKENDIYTS
jgi:hypothetical protein